MAEENTQQEPEQQSPEQSATAVEASKLAEAEKQVEYYKDLLYRKAAEFENYKKRSENEAVSIMRFASESLIADLLPVIDDFERSIKAAKNSKDFESLYRGIELVQQKFLKVLEKRGVKAFETVGKEFNVEFHDALLQIPRDDVPSHTVLEEIDKGYMLNDKVIRHAKVIVSTEPADTSTSSGETQPVAQIQPESGKS
jgi:molecular chaperone GrpE